MTAAKEPSAYVSEVDYPAGFYANQAPVHLSYVCALNGIKGPNPAGPYRYCELGAGAGKTLAVLAASNPESEFLGIDINPVHVAAAQTLVRSGGVRNAKFIVADVAGPGIESLAEFDFITMHGLYGWVSESVRQAIRRFIDAKLRPGGLVYVTYNTLPGWGSAGQMRRYFQDRARQLDGEITDKVVRILDELEMLRREGAPFFQANPNAAEVLERMRGADPRYVTHEFLGPDWQAIPFADVQAEMAQIGLAFAADAQIVENLLDVVLPGRLAEHVRRQESRLSQEMAKDFISNRFFRSDVYVRPSDSADGIDDSGALSDVLLGLEKTPQELSATVELADRTITLAGKSAERLKELLAIEPAGVADILSHPEVSSGGATDRLNTVKLLTAGRQLIPFARQTVAQEGPLPEKILCRPPLNRMLLEAEGRPGNSVVLASPVAGTGISIAPLEACLLLALETDDPVSAAAEQLTRRGLQLNEGGRVLTDLQETRAALAQILPAFISGKLPKLISLEIVEASA